MRMGFNLHLEQSQKLIMTPQLQQAIQILQFASMELEQYVSEQLETNPVLEEIIENEKSNISEEKIAEDKIKDINWKEYIEDFNNYEYTKGNYYNEESDFSFENIVSKESTLHEHLLFQYNITFSDKKHMQIGEYLINSLDERGYLTFPVADIANHFGEDEAVVENILQIIQTFDPPGVGARTLQECLILQLKALEIKDEKLYSLIQDYLPEIASNKYPLVAKQLKISVEQVQGYCDFIKTLEPRPGRKFSLNQNRYIIPDVIVKKIGHEYVVLTNDSCGPRLTIRDDYKKMITSGLENTEVIKYLNDQFNSAAWLIRSIEQRKQTIYKVAEIIIKKQIVFFEKGKKHLRTMTLKEVADEAQVHESTVSRATNGKYIETPVGTFELKYFFSSGVEDVHGEGISSQSIKSFMQDIINEEDPKKPLSDDKIVEKLLAKGINISRRTVAKYRDDMGVPSSTKRKRY